MKALVEPTMLVWARESANLEPVAADRKIRVPEGWVSEWEAGDRAPTIAELRRAGQVYNRSLAVFFLSEPPQGFETLRDFRRIDLGQSSEWSADLHAEYRRAHGQREALLEIAELDDQSPVSVWRLTGLPDDDAAIARRARAFLEHVLVGLRYQPNTIPSIARPFARWKPDLADGWANILNLVAEDDSMIEAAAWAYALAIEAYRSPVVPYAIADLLDEHGGYNEYDLLAIATAEAVEELANLEELAETNLYPHLGAPPTPDNTIEHGWRRAAAWTDPKPTPGDTPRWFGPTFTASALCQADADLIYDGTLYELKTRLGRKNPDDTRTDALPLIDLYQAIAYALFDTHDQYGIRHIAVYSARYGRHTQWLLDDLLSALAGRTIDIAEERATVWRLLGGEPTESSTP